MKNSVVQEAPWPLSLQHKTVAATVKASHSPVHPASKAFMKDWHKDTKRKEAIEHAENVVAPIVELFNT